MSLGWDSELASTWPNYVGQKSLVCTPRNAQFLLKFQTLSSTCPRTQDDFLSLAPANDNLPYLYKIEPKRKAETTQLMLTYGDNQLLEFLGAKRGDLISEIFLGGLERIWEESLLTTLERNAPMIVRFFVGISSSSPRQFESLTLPLKDPQGCGPGGLLGAFDEVGTLGSHVRRVDWSAITVSRASRLVIAQPIDA